jgi:hypothetical protein
VTTTRTSRGLIAIAAALLALCGCYESIREVRGPAGAVTMERGRCRELTTPVEPDLICTDRRRFLPGKTALVVTGIVVFTTIAIVAGVVAASSRLSLDLGVPTGM